MSTPFVVAFVPGVTPGKWARTWNERMPQFPLELRPSTVPIADLGEGLANVALVRLGAPLGDELSAIPLYEEQPFVIAPKEHAIEAVDSVTLADLESENVLEADPLDANDVVELVAANVGVAVLPQSVARAHSRRDIIARPVTDAAPTTIALVWVAASTTPEVEEFIGIVRGRTANSSRGSVAPTAKPEKPTKKRPAAGGARKPSGSQRNPRQKRRR